MKILFRGLNVQRSYFAKIFFWLEGLTQFVPKYFWLEGLTQFVIVPPKYFWLEGLAQFVMGAIMGSTKLFLELNIRHGYVWDHKNTPKIFLTRRAYSIRHCTPKIFLARRACPIRHGCNYGLDKIIFGTQYTTWVCLGSQKYTQNIFD